jgi:hypothetical protein
MLLTSGRRTCFKPNGNGTLIGAVGWFSLGPSNELFSSRTPPPENPTDGVCDLDLRHVGINVLKAARDERISCRRRGYSIRQDGMKAAISALVPTEN